MYDSLQFERRVRVQFSFDCDHRLHLTVCNGLQVLYKDPIDDSVQVGYINSFSSEKEYKWSAIYPQKVAPEEHISGHCCCFIIIVIVDIAQRSLPRYQKHREGTNGLGRIQSS